MLWKDIISFLSHLLSFFSLAVSSSSPKLHSYFSPRGFVLKDNGNPTRNEAAYGKKLPLALKRYREGIKRRKRKSLTPDSMTSIPKLLTQRVAISFPSIQYWHLWREPLWSPQGLLTGIDAPPFAL